MNREILFRGKRVDNGEWVIGSLVKMGPAGYVHYFILPDYASAFYDIEVDPATVCQDTGLTDKNGVKIFEGDIISYNKSKEVVRFDTSIRIPCFTTGIGSGSSTARHPYKISKRHMVIGNVHDNPEILGGNDGTTDR